MAQHTQALLDLPARTSSTLSPAPPPQLHSASLTSFLSLEHTRASTLSQAFPVTLSSAWITLSPDSRCRSLSFPESTQV